MAGIGFALRELDRRDSIFGSIASIGHGAVVSAGPWIFTVLAIALIHRGTAGIIDPEMSYNFRGLVIYCFALSLLATAPVVNVAIRQIADDIYLEEFQNVRPRYIATLLVSCLISGVVAVAVHGGIFRLAPLDLLVEVVSTMIVGLIWPTLAFCGAVKDYKGITFGFVVGLLISIFGTIWTAAHGYNPAIMMLTFVSGLSLVFFWLASRVLVSFPHPVTNLSEHLIQLARGFWQYRALAIASFVAIGAIWMDKWVMWFGPTGVPLQNGLLSAPTYDGAMFVAYLTIIPALGLFVTSIETGFFEDLRHLSDTIQGRAPLDRINRSSENLEKKTFQTIYKVLMVQGIICVISIIGSVAFLPWLGLKYEQLGILRLGIIGAFFQFMFLTCTSILLFFDRHVRFLILQLVFLTLQFALTALSVKLGPEYFGYGHLLACAISAFFSVVVLERTLGKAVYLTFSAALRQPGKRRRKPVQQKTIVSQSPAAATESWIEPIHPIDSVGPLLRP